MIHFEKFLKAIFLLWSVVVERRVTFRRRLRLQRFVAVKRQRREDLGRVKMFFQGQDVLETLLQSVDAFIDRFRAERRHFCRRMF